MNHKEYIEAALQTEKPLDQNLPVKLDFIRAVFQLVIQTGKLMDLLKRELFYGKKVPDLEMLKILREIVRIADLVYETREYKPKKMPVNFRMVHGIVGKVTESAELVETLEKAIDTKGKISESMLFNIKEELGDSYWYDAVLFDHFGLVREEIEHMNVAKLTKRAQMGAIQNPENRDYEKEKAAAKAVMVSTPVGRSTPPD